MVPVRGLFFLAVVALTGLGCDGDAATERREFPAFHEIETEGAFDLHVTTGATQSVDFEGDARDLEILDARVFRGRLKLEADFRQHDDIGVTIVLDGLDALDLSGTNDATVNGISGESFELVTAGSGDVMITGACGDLEIEINGSALVDTKQFECRNVDIVINGSGDAETSVMQDLAVTISGSGEVGVIGHPQGKISLSVSGSGKIEID
jgi:hypothetical protein